MSQELERLEQMLARWIDTVIIFDRMGREIRKSEVRLSAVIKENREPFELIMVNCGILGLVGNMVGRSWSGFIAVDKDVCGSGRSRGWCDGSVLVAMVGISILGNVWILGIT